MSTHVRLLLTLILPAEHMDFPDLAPWFDNPSDGYEELPAGEIDTPYDE